MPATLLTLEPSRDLVFPKTPSAVPVARGLKLLNTTSGFVAFRLKTTATKAFVTKPGSAVIPAGGTMDVQILLQQGQTAAADNQRFLVEAIATDTDELIPKDKWATFKRGEVVQYRLSVALRDEPLPTPRAEVVEDPRIAELRMQLEQEQDLRKTLQARIDELEQMLRDAKAEKLAAGEEAAAALLEAQLEGRRQLADADAENKRLAVELEALQKAGIASQDALKELEQRLAVDQKRFEQELEAKRQATVEVEEQLEKSKIETEDLQRLQEASAQTIVQLEKELADSRAQRVSSASGGEARLVVQITDLERKLEEANIAYRTLSVDQAALLAELQRVEHRVAETDTANGTLSKDKAALGVQITDLERRVAEANAANGTFSNDKDVLVQRIAVLERQIAEANAADEKLQLAKTGSAGEVAAELARTAAALAEATAEVERLKRRLAESEGRGAATAPNSDLERQLREALEERARVEQELAEQRNIAGYLHSQLPEQSQKTLVRYLPQGAPASWPSPPPLPGNNGFVPRKWYTESDNAAWQRQLAEAEQARAAEIAELKRQLAEATQELADQCDVTAYVHSQLPQEKKQSLHRYVPIGAPPSWPTPPKLPGNTGFVPRKWYSEQDLADVEKKLADMQAERDSALQRLAERDSALQRLADLEQSSSTVLRTIPRTDVGKRREFEIRYLPENYEGKQLLVETKDDEGYGTGLYRVDNSELQSPVKGMTYRKSKELSDKDSNLTVTWDSLVEGELQDGWLTVMIELKQDFEIRYLPEHHEGKQLLLESEEAGWYRVDNSELQSPAKGFTYRNTRDMEDKDSSLTVTWDTLVEGELKDGWLTVKMEPKPEVKGFAACILGCCPCFAGFACLLPAERPLPHKVLKIAG